MIAMNIKSITVTIKKGKLKDAPCTDYEVNVEAIDHNKPIRAMEALHLLTEGSKMVIDEALNNKKG